MSDYNPWVTDDSSTGVTAVTLMSETLEAYEETPDYVPDEQQGDYIDYFGSFTEPSSKSDVTWYGGGYFECREDGVYYITPPSSDGDQKSAKEDWICSRLVIEATTSCADGRSEGWGRLLVFKDLNGHVHRWPMPMSMLKGDGGEYRGELLDRGLLIAPGQKMRNLLTAYIQITSPKRHAGCVSSSGWYQQHFILPDGAVIGDDQQLIYLQSDRIMASGVGSQGTIDEWRETIGQWASGNSRLQFAIGMAFAAPLLRLVKEEGGGFHLEGGSSIGKTTILTAAASVHGAPGYVKTWRATANGVEATALAHNDLLLILDEIQQVDPGEAGEIAYMLGNGRQKQRANRSGGARATGTWLLLFLSSGEKGLSDHMMSGGKKSTAGQEIRLIDLPADAGGASGVFDTLHEFENGDGLSRAIKTAAAQNYGAVGREYLEQVCRSHDKLPAMFNTFLNDFLKDNIPDGASGQVRRAAQRFALVAFAGELATQFGLTGWEEGEATQAAARLFREWQEARGGAGELERSKLLSQVRLFFQQYSESKFAPMDDPDYRIPERAGFRRPEGGSTAYYVLPEVFKAEVVNGFPVKRAIKYLVDAGLIEPRNPKDNQHVIRVSGNLMRFYKFTSKVFGVGDDPNDVTSVTSKNVKPGSVEQEPDRSELDRETE